MLRDSLVYPKSGDDWLRTVLIGGALAALGSFFLLPLLPVQGYLVRVLRSGARNERDAPVFDEWLDISIDGLKLIGVQIAYVLVPAAVLAVGAAVGGVGTVGDSTAGAAVGLAGLAVAAMGGLLTLVAAYLIPAAMANFAAEDDLGAAFDLRTVVDAATSMDYLVAVLLAVVVGVVLGAVALALTAVLVGVFLTFYVQVSVYYLFGRGYADGLAASR